MGRRLGLAAWALYVAVSAAGCGNSAQTPPAQGSGGTGSGATGTGASPSTGAGGSSTGTCAVGLSLCGTTCVDLQTSGTSCGTCSTVCPSGQVCQAGACQCPAGLTACGALCVDTKSDAANCGTCATACTAPQVCSLSVCSDTCASGLTQCGSSCVDINLSAIHCGGCDNPCSNGQGCQAGSCACPTAGQIACGGTCVDTQSNAANCGSCGTVCGAGQTCTAGACIGGTGTGGDGSGTGGDGTGTAGTGVGTGGETAAAGSGSGDEVPDGLAGVAIDMDETEDGVDKQCIPLCLEAEHADDDVTDDDWAYEGYACILPATPTSDFNQTCTTGQAIPERDTNGLPGVVLDEDDVEDTITPYCKALCEGTESSGDDPSWGWEYQESCIISGSTVGACNLGCTTGAALPDLASVRRPGVMIDVDGEPTCLGLCECEHTCTDAQIEDWGCDAEADWQWEYLANCIVPGSETATDKPTCTTNEVTSFVPPAVSGSHPGFYTENGKLYDAKGAEFVIRGVNNPHIWFDPDNQYLAYGALDTIASYKTNAIRVVWESSGSATLLAQVLYRIVELEMIPIVEMHDATGKSDTASLQAEADYFLQADVQQVLTDFRAYVLINIANEWSGNLSAYGSVISSLRSGGIQHTLVIDASGSGQDISSIITAAPSLMSGDTGEGKLLFSVHMYGQYGSASAVTDALSRAQSASIPLIVGEFGPQHSGVSVAWTTIVNECQTRDIGYIPWSWKGNGDDTANLDMASEWKGPLTDWGQNVMVSHNASIQKTAQKASIFE